MRAVVLLVPIALASCSRLDRERTPAASASASAASAPALASASASPSNDGTDPNAPVLSPDDVGFADGQKGWGWGNRCFAEIKQGKWGWARAACDRGLALAEVDPKARASLLYNEGLIAKKGGDKAVARKYFAQSLAMRPPDDPGRAEVEKELVSVGGSVPAAPKKPAGECPDSRASKFKDGQCHIFCMSRLPCPANMECSGYGVFADGSGEGPYCEPAAK